ncbi:Bestrophin, RFP-TM, chloride channel-domain-containing protein [Dunaliella salina]|uniref:Bestrophin, RFP-TM, chloride channel-domain-containing protein n=2 Tax=Dunaliella salina TaxID=3046 RepID=A0ABQ7GIV2_DUNSA|nr:Bestrophin, RFP-TM, chloride channel-domain-containing protein [Dunaliella salina]|eukprot:KAF5834518.1 Bestrophin, RFP-TM, chloride channel-domain-containing protein [Dunaliella salina]
MLQSSSSYQCIPNAWNPRSCTCINLRPSWSRRRSHSTVARAQPQPTYEQSQLVEDFSTPFGNSDPDAELGSNVFTFSRWAMHRRTGQRYIRHMTGIWKSNTWRNLLPCILAFTANGALLGVYQSMLDSNMLPPWIPSLDVTDGPFELTSFALALLLVFRTDSSYGRWNEAMEIWTEVRGVSKDIVRASACWIKDPALLAMVVSSAYPHYALHVLTQAVEKAGMAGTREDKVLSSIANLNKAVGTCEKLLRYPIPLSYTRHTSRFLCCWLGLLPLALWDDAGWGVIPITALISYLLLGIEEIGVQIEEPFDSLPLEDFVRDIEKDLGNIIASREDVGSLIKTSISLTANTKMAQAMIAKHKKRQQKKAKIQLGIGEESLEKQLAASGAKDA